MTNRLMVEHIYADVLEHHGVEGQRWGVQNGPPYPLSGDNKRQAQREYKEAKRQKRAEEKEAEITKKKSRIIGKGDVKAMRRHPEWFNQQEMEAVLKKNATLNAAKPSKSVKMTKAKRKALDEADLEYIKRHPEEFTSEEMAYSLQRRKLLDEQHNKSKHQVKKERDLEDTYAKIQKAAAIAASATTILTLAKTGMDVVKTFKDVKTKDADYEDKRFKSRFDNLSKMSKSMALEEFNNYWKTDYKIEDIDEGKSKKENRGTNANNAKGSKGNNTKGSKNSKKNRESVNNGKKYVKASVADRTAWRGSPSDSTKLFYDSTFNTGYDWYTDWSERNGGYTLKF